MNPYVWIAALLALILAVGGGFYAGHHYEYISMQAAQVKAVKASQTQYEAVLDAQRKDAYDASDSYQKELARLRAAPAVPVYVSVCNRPANPQMPMAASPGGSAPAGETGGVVQSAAPRNIGPDLENLMLEADQCSAQLRGLQAWASKLDAP